MDLAGTLGREERRERPRLVVLPAPQRQVPQPNKALKLNFLVYF